MEEFKRLRVPDYLNAVAWNVDNTRLAGLSNFGSTITVWETAQWSVVNQFKRNIGNDSFNSLSYLPNGTLLTAAPIGQSPDPRYQTLRIFALLQWDPESGRVLRYIPDPLPPVGFTIDTTGNFQVSLDGKWIAGVMVGSREGRVLVFDARDLKLVRDFVVPPTPQHSDSGWCTTFSPDSREIAIGSVTGWAHVFDLETGALRLSFRAYADDIPCTAIAFSPDGKTLATGRGGVGINTPDDGRIRLWNSANGEHLTSLFGGVGGIEKFAWSRDSRLAAAYDRSLMVWQIDTKSSPLMLNVTAATYCAAWSGHGLLAATHENKVALYRNQAA